MVARAAHGRLAVETICSELGGAATAGADHCTHRTDSFFHSVGDAAARQFVSISKKEVKRKDIFFV